MQARKLGKILLFCLAGVLVLILILLLGAKLLLDRAPRYQAEIKDWVHSQTGFHIAFARVSPALRWYGPELYFDHLELRSKDDRRVLARTAGGRVAADIWALISSGKLLAGRVELDAPNIVVVRVGPDTFALASEIELRGEDSSLAKLTLDDLPAGKLSIRGGLLTIQNWNAALPQLQLRAIDLDLRRNDEGIALEGVANLPAVLGGIFIVQGAARGLGDLNTLTWKAWVRARGISFPGWRRLLPGHLSRLDAGSGEFEVAARGQGRNLVHADLDFAAHAVVTKPADGPSVQFEEISGALTVTHAADRWTVMGRRMRALNAGRRDPDSNFDLHWRGKDSGLLELRARASYLRTATLLPLMGLLPLPDIRERLREFAPTGEWLNTSLEAARTAPGDPWRLQVHGAFHGLGFAAVGGAPGMRGLDGRIAGNESGGHLDIDSHNAVFSWPQQFSSPVPLELLKSTLYWRNSADGLLVATPKFEFGNRDANVQGRVAWQQPGDGGSPLITLASSVENADAAHARNYLPRQLLSSAALAWLDRAFVAGHLSHADAVMRGPLRHFPFRDGSGLFLVRLAVDGMSLDYREGWPRVDSLSAQVEFRNQGLTGRLSSGRIGNITLASADGRLADFKEAEIEVHATARSDAADALDFLRATPLDALAGHAFSSVEGRGPLQSKIDLFLPIKEFDRRRIRVHLHLNGVALKLPGSTWAAGELKGDADLDGAQVAAAEVRGKLLGGSFQMTARAPRNRPVTRTQLEFHGTLSGDALRAALSLPAAVTFAGQTDWRGTLKMAPDPARERSLRIASTLVGLELKVPDPLAKPAAASLPSWVEIQWPRSDVPQARVSVGNVLHGAFTVESDANGSSRLGRLAVMFGPGESVLSNTQTVNVGGSVGRVDLAGWLKLNPPNKNAKPLANYLRTAKLEVAQLDYLGLSFLDVGLALTVNDTSLRIAVSGPNVVGTLSLPTGSAAAEPWNLQFERLKFVDAPVNALAGAARADPHGIAAINFHAAQLTWGERQFGDVRATLAKLEDGISLKELNVTGVHTLVSATGEWRGKDAGLGRIAGTLSSADVGATLQQLGFGAVIQAKSGHMDFDLNWVGAPTADSLSEALGHVQVALDKGQIVGLNPGAGRVFGLASVAELRRRLALDFSDLTDKGFTFDSARGDFDLREGSVFTDNVLVKGPAAEIGLIGRVGLKARDYDQTAVVTGTVSDSLPLAAFAGGPVFGAAVLVFTQVFKQPLKGLARGYYRITGKWAKPMVERITSADAAAAAAEAPK